MSAGNASFPELATERLLLRALRQEDAARLLEIYGDEEVVLFYDLPPLGALAEAKALLETFCSRFEAGTGVRWGIVERASGRLIGDCGFNRWRRDNRSADIGYLLAREAWGRGLATEAGRALLTFAFELEHPFRLNRIVATVDPRNVASRNVLTKLGLRCEGVQRDAVFFRGAFQDEARYGILRREFVCADARTSSA